MTTPTTNSELLAVINRDMLNSGKALDVFTPEFCRSLNQHDVRVFMVAADKQVAKNRDLQNQRAAEGLVFLASLSERIASRWEMIFTNLYECYSWEPTAPAPTKEWALVKEAV